MKLDRTNWKVYMIITKIFSTRERVENGMSEIIDLKSLVWKITNSKYSDMH